MQGESACVQFKHVTILFSPVFLKVVEIEHGLSF